MKAIFQNELRTYFTTLTGYAFAAFILLFVGLYSFVLNLTNNLVNFEYVLTNMSFIFLIVIPILTMRSFAEERRQKTDQLLYSLPLSMTQIVMGKFLAMMVVLLLPTVLICIYPLILRQYGPVPMGTVYSTVVAFVLLGGSLSAIGLFISSLTESMAISAGLCFTTLLLLYYMSSITGAVATTALSSLVAFAVVILLLGLIMRVLTKSTPISLLFTAVCECVLVGAYLLWENHFAGLFASVINSLSVFERFYTFGQGQFDLANVVFFLSIIVICLFMTVQSLEKRRWNG